MNQQMAMRNLKAGNFESTTENLDNYYDQQNPHYSIQNKLKFPTIIDTEADENIQDRSSEELKSSDRQQFLHPAVFDRGQTDDDTYRTVADPVTTEQIHREADSGFMSHRHLLGFKNKGFKPTLMNHDKYVTANPVIMTQEQSTVVQDTRRLHLYQTKVAAMPSKLQGQNDE